MCDKDAKNILEQLEDISKEEELNEAIEHLPTIGVYDPKRDAVILPASERSSDDDYWDRIYRSTHPDAKI